MIINNIYKTIIEHNEKKCKVSLNNISFGMGHTIGNVLRRVSLHTILRHKVIGISGKGVESLWSNIENIEENIYEIIFNINKITLPYDAKLIHSDSLIYGEINKKGECTTKDIKFYTDSKFTQKYNIEINEEYLFTTNIEKQIIFYFKPVGEFLMNEEAESKFKKELSEDNVVFLPVNTSPEFNFEYHIEETPKTDSQSIHAFNKEKLVIELKNDGCIDPIQQLDQIIETSQQLFLNIQKIYKIDSENDIQFHNISLNELKKNNAITYRTYNILVECGIEYLEQLQQLTYSELDKLSKLGVKSIKQIKNLMQLFKLKFKDEKDGTTLDDLNEEEIALGDLNEEDEKLSNEEKNENENENEN